MSEELGDFDTDSNSTETDTEDDASNEVQRIELVRDPSEEDIEELREKWESYLSEEVETLDARKTTLERAEPRDPLGDDFMIGDPAIDLANGRSVVVVEKLADRVDEYDDYDLLGNYAAQRTRVRPADPVYGCLYTSSVQSEPSGPRRGDPPYAFPSSRLGRPTLESVEGYDRPYYLVARDVLDRMFQAATGAMEPDNTEMLASVARDAGLDEELIEEARELADAATWGGAKSNGGENDG